VLNGDVNVEIIKDNQEEAHIDQVQIRVNSRDEVIGKDNDGVVAYSFKWNAKEVRPLHCGGISFHRCCRAMQRYTGKSEDDKDIGCYREKSYPTAHVHKGLKDDVSFTEYIYSNDNNEIELTYVDRGGLTIFVYEGSDGMVHELPFLNAEMSLNPAEEITSYLAKSVGTGISSNTMSVSGGSSGASVFAEGMGDTWWYGIPLGIGIFSACSCCAFVFYMCCIPVKDEDLMAPEKFREAEGVEEMGQQTKPL
jgi:hypothetical protein